MKVEIALTFFYLFLSPYLVPFLVRPYGLPVRTARTTSPLITDYKLALVGKEETFNRNKEPLLGNNQPVLRNNMPVLQNNMPVLQNNPHILTFLIQTMMYRAFGHVRDNGFSLTSP